MSSQMGSSAAQASRMTWWRPWRASWRLHRPAVVRIWQGPGGEPQEQGTRQVVGGTLRPGRRLTEHQTRFLQAHAPGPIKMTVPSPNQFPAISFQPGVTELFYPTRAALLWALVPIIKGEIAALVEDGVAHTFKSTNRATATTLIPSGASTCVTWERIPTRCSLRPSPPTTPAWRACSGRA